MKNKLLGTIVLLAILLAVSIGLNVSQWRQAKEEQLKRYLDNGRAQVEIAAKQAEIDTAAGRIQALQEKVGKDSLKFRTREIARNAEIKGYKVAIARLRPLVAAKIDSFPDLRDFVANQDSVISKQDSLLRDTELFCQLQVRDLSKIIELQEQKYEAQKQITAAVTEQLAKETREHRKTKRRSALKSVGLGILTLGVVIISLKE